MHHYKERVGPESGATLLELIAVLAIFGLIVAATGLFLEPAEAPVQSAASQVGSLFRQARSLAMASTSAVRVRPASDSRLEIERAANCASVAWTADPELRLDLPTEVSLTDSAWAVCFNARGISSTNLTVTLSHPYLNSRQVEVLLGGATRIGS